MRSRLRAVVALSAFFLTPRVGAAGPSRFFGNMPLLLDPDPFHFPFHFARHHIAEDSNLLVLHMDWFPIPWKEFAAGGSLPPAWAREMDAIDALRRDASARCQPRSAPS